MDHDSVVDLLKSKGLDSSMEARQHLWRTYGMPAEPAYTGTAEQNEALLEKVRAGAPSLWERFVAELSSLIHLGQYKT